MSGSRALVGLAWAIAAAAAPAAEADPGGSSIAAPPTSQRAPVLLPSEPSEPSLPPGLQTPAAPALSPQPPTRPSIAPESAHPPPVARPPEVDPALQGELARLRAVAARNGRPAGRAAWELGLAALHGVGGPVDPPQARNWFTRAQRLGEPLAAAGLAWCAIDGCGGPADPAEARRWIAALRPYDGPRAQYLDWLLASERAPLSVSPEPLLSGPESAPTPRQGRSTGPPLHAQLEAAARAGSAQARLELGLAAAAEGREAEALAHFRAAAPQSSAAAANVALLGQRVGAPAAPGLGQATFERAQRAHRGIGQPANFTEAVRLYQQAQQEGSTSAGRMLALIFSRPSPEGGVDIAWMQQLAQVDVTRQVPAVDPSAGRGALRREPTPLADMLPGHWRQRALRSRDAAYRPRRRYRRNRSTLSRLIFRNAVVFRRWSRMKRVADATVPSFTAAGRRPAVLVVGALAGLAILLRASIQPFVGDTHQFEAAYAAMSAATWLCGWQAGVATALLCGLAGQFFPPVSELDHQLAHVAMAYMGYFGVSTAAVSAVEWLRRERLETEEAGRKLDHAGRRAAEFMAVVSHELRTPLTTLVRDIESLERRRADWGEVARTLPLMRRQTRQMTKLVDDLFESSRLEIGDLCIKREPTDLLVAVQEAVLDVRASVNEKRQRVRIIRDAVPGTIFIDPRQLRRILVNVLDNASKFSPENSQIHVVVSGREYWTCVSVADEGAGLTPAQLEDIFEPFAHGAVSPTAGSGLRIGLPLARRLARLHGGNLRAFSAGPQRGSEFLLSLPRALPVSDSPVAAPDPGPAPVGVISAPGVA